MTTHLELPVKPTIRVGTGAPSSTVGAAGDVYIDDATGEIYYREELSWTQLPSAGSISIGGAITGSTAGSVLFADSSGDLAQNNAAFFWDDANERLGLGTDTPSGVLHVTTAAASGNVVIDGTEQVVIGADLGVDIVGTLVASDAGDIRFSIDPVTGDIGIGSRANQSAIVGSSNRLKLHTILDSQQARYIGIRANDALSASYDLQLPAAQGSADQFLANDGSGNLAWAAKRAPSHNADWVTADTATKAITHNLGTRDVHVTVYDVSDYATILVDSVVRTDINTVTLTASEAPGASGWRVLITAAN